MIFVIFANKLYEYENTCRIKFLISFFKIKYSAFTASEYVQSSDIKEGRLNIKIDKNSPYYLIHTINTIFYVQIINFKKINRTKPGTPKTPIIKAEYIFKAI